MNNLFAIIVRKCVKTCRFLSLPLYSLLLIILISLPVAAEVGVRPASEISNDTIDWMKKVADWQLTQSSWDSSVDWLRGALHAGMIACYEATKDETYLDSCRQWANKFNWQLASTSHHADNNAVGQVFMELYFLDQQDPNRYEGTSRSFKNVSDAHVALWPTFHCDTTSDSNVWWWCDALFMAPPGLVRLNRATGDSSYVDLMHKMWGNTQSCLYDTTEHLFFRDINYFYPDRQNCNGEKVFWSRGNGWVLAGTARMLQYLPQTDPNRPRYETLLQEMAAKLKEIQQPDGYWHSDLLGPNCYDNPETSGTGFFTFGIAWGINNGYLDAATYWPTVEAGWEALKAAVQPSGLLGYVQPVGAGPAGASPTSTNVYGVGAYLLAGSEVYKYLLAHDPNSIEYFGSYTDDATLLTAWADGSTNGTSSQVALGDYGDNFMELTYHNDQSPYRSETVCTFVSPKDFTANDAYYLSVLVRGNAANTTEQMYVRLQDVNTDSAVKVVTEPNIVQTSQWIELGFPLSDFMGLDLTQISKLTIGVGAPDASSPTGQGTIRIDNIRLDRQQCAFIPANLVSDCMIDLLDFEVIASQWLDDYRVVIEPVDPGTENLTAYWAFEDVNYGYAYDSVSDEYNAQFRDDAVWDETGGKGGGGAASFAGPANTASRVEIPTTGLSLSAGTVAMWLYPSTNMNPSTRYIFGHTSPSTSWGNRIQLYLDGGNTDLDMGLGNSHSLSTGNYTLPTEEWTHIALTWDGTNYQMYVNGRLTSSGPYSGLSVLQDETHIGNDGYFNPYESFNGLIDEVQIYDAVLSPSNMLYLAEADPVIEISDPVPADLFVDGIIDVKDLEILISVWFQKISWP